MFWVSMVSIALGDTVKQVFPGVFLEVCQQFEIQVSYTSDVPQNAVGNHLGPYMCGPLEGRSTKEA